MTSTGPSSPAPDGPEGTGGPEGTEGTEGTDRPTDAAKDAPADGAAGSAADSATGPAADSATVYADRVFRSNGNVVWGCLLLAVAAWLAVDAMLKSEARTVWTVLAGLVFAVPLVVAFLLRPAVYVNDNRLRIRNPFRSIVLPWAKVDAVRTGYSSEVLADGSKYQLWAIPVSLRQRKKAVRNQARAAAADDPRASRTSFGRTSPAGRSGARLVAASDQTVQDLQEMAEVNAGREEARGEVVVRWAYEVIVPCVIGLLALITLLAT
ncbi:PH domain-containing protein [Streptomyces sp. NPDC004111]|uniref:PH domain-containing protein n=1 Tax=Streptomyces sp. NPDC004111 TaxID=3364690 RepID=UPI0036876C36